MVLDCDVLGDDQVAIEQNRHFAFRIQAQELRRPLFALRKIEGNRAVGRSDLFEYEVGCK
jgi:hypothetical protein